MRTINRILRERLGFKRSCQITSLFGNSELLLKLLELTNHINENIGDGPLLMRMLLHQFFLLYWATFLRGSAGRNLVAFSRHIFVTYCISQFLGVVVMSTNFDSSSCRMSIYSRSLTICGLYSLFAVNKNKFPSFLQIFTV